LLAALVTALVVGVGTTVPALAAGDPGSQAKVVGGKGVPDGKYPFVAALLDTRYGSTAREQQFCTGTLIDEDSVLTAAHCVVGTSPQPLRVTVGRTVLSSEQGQERAVSAISVHPSYDGRRSSAYDAAVLELSGPDFATAPVALAAAGNDSLERPGHRARIAGWGKTDGGFPDRMQEASVPVVSDAQADKVYRRAFVPALMVAAGKTGVDTCVGDSGGPMFAQTPGGPRQIGITSFGANRCGARGVPGVYTEVNAPSIRNFVTNAAGN
jgi:secreted trypsin-like serine protease